jgi:hypothetical protein
VVLEIYESSNFCHVFLMHLCNVNIITESMFQPNVGDAEGYNLSYASQNFNVDGMDILWL